MTNAVGYYYDEREERINITSPNFNLAAHTIKNADSRRGYYTVDINRDFPYN